MLEQFKLLRMDLTGVSFYKKNKDYEVFWFKLTLFNGHSNSDTQIVDERKQG